MFKSFWGSQEQQAQPRPEIQTDSWYPNSVTSSSPSSSRPATPQSFSPVSPAEAAGIIPYLNNKSVDELKKLLSDKEAYHRFLLSLDIVKTQNKVKNELQNETVQLARQNLEKEPQLLELRNQCSIIRTTELAAAKEKLNELQRRKDEILKFYSPASLLHRLQDEIKKTDEESENLHRKLLEGDIELAGFVQKYKKLRNTYHRRALTHLAAKTSVTT